jgi:hypothetical protein
VQLQIQRHAHPFSLKNKQKVMAAGRAVCLPIQAGANNDTFKDRDQLDSRKRFICKAMAPPYGG